MTCPSCRVRTVVHGRRVLLLRCPGTTPGGSRGGRLTSRRRAFHQRNSYTTPVGATLAADCQTGGLAGQRGRTAVAVVTALSCRLAPVACLRGEGGVALRLCDLADQAAVHICGGEASAGMTRHAYGGVIAGQRWSAAAVTDAGEATERKEAGHADGRPDR